MFARLFQSVTQVSMGEKSQRCSCKDVGHTPYIEKDKYFSCSTCSQAGVSRVLWTMPGIVYRPPFVLVRVDVFLVHGVWPHVLIE